MPADSWLALALFAFVSSITPGPNNLLATASGARFGLRRTLPQIAGVTFGFTILLWLATSGVAALIASHPTIGLALSIAGYAYLAWLSLTLLASAWNPAPDGLGDGPMRQAVRAPLTFWQSAAFQFANPKAWMMALSAASAFIGTEGRSLGSIVALGALFAVINFPCVGAWAVLGAHLQRWLNSPTARWRLRAFNAAMGFTLLATTASMVALR